MNILCPSAGLGKRFSSKGYVDPKPFVRINGKYIIEYALSSFDMDGKYFVITSQLDKKYMDILDSLYKKYKIDGYTINLTHSTAGATETCLAVKSYINMDDPLIIMLSDQYTPWNCRKFLNFINSGDYDAVVTTYNHPNVVMGCVSPYSFIKVDDNNIAVEFSEKFAISLNSLNGIHYWKKAKLFFESAEELMNSDIHINGEKYLSLTFQFLIKKGKKITYYKMEDHEFVSLGSPDEIERNINKL